MKRIFTLALALPLFLALLACNSKSSPMQPFAKQDQWDFAKQQRWKQMQDYMKDNATQSITGTQDAAISHAKAAHWTAAAQMQEYLDGFEQRRTGNPAAHSCRTVTDIKQRYDATHCTQDQLTAEFFQQDEEQHGFK
jgi:hypothetical protein